ncbi:MAG: Hsp20/alpha crystallin family protein [Candidatus Hydrogenedentes bacterium]|nr:Hsp20/alpha crystallin family protein [Candidatus Hydrogenedentota bacterium]
MSDKNTPVKASNEMAPGTRETAQTLEPAVDIFEINDGLVVVADLPGVDKENASVRVDDGLLTIEGKTAASTHGEPLFSEYSPLNFYRQFRLGIHNPLRQWSVRRYARQWMPIDRNQDALSADGRVIMERGAEESEVKNP